MSKKIYTPSVNLRTARPRCPRLQSLGGYTVVERSDSHTARTIDTEMSETSDNAVANRIIKAYADLSPKYKVVEEVLAPKLPDGNTPGKGGEGTGSGSSATSANMRLRYIDGVLYVYSDIDLDGAKVQLGRLGRSYSGKKSRENRRKKHGWRIYNPGSKKDRNFQSDTRLEELRLNLVGNEPLGYRYGVEFVTLAGSDSGDENAKRLASCFGNITEINCSLTTSRGKCTVYTYDESEDFAQASQIFAIVINGHFLPFRLIVTNNTISDNGLEYTLTPL